MKFSPIPTTGVAVAVAAVSAGVVALSRLKSKNDEKPVSTKVEDTKFTAEEWERFKTWPAQISSDSASNEVASAVENFSAVEASSFDPAELADEPETRTVIGHEDGEVEPFGRSYTKIIKNAFLESQVNEDFTLELYGKTYGLGARGLKLEGLDVPGVRYDKDDIAKLHEKLVRKLES